MSLAMDSLTYDAGYRDGLVAARRECKEMLDEETEGWSPRMKYAMEIYLSIAVWLLFVGLGIGLAFRSSGWTMAFLLAGIGFTLLAGRAKQVREVNKTRGIR